MSATAERRGWALLAVGALAVAGVLALLLAVSRTPHAQDWLPWSPEFFYRALITHVVLSIEVWFLACLGLLSATVAGGGRSGPAGLALAVAGTLLLLVPAIADQGEPSLNNYLPVLQHPLFYAGLLLFAGGIGLACLRLLPLLFRPPSVVAFAVACTGGVYFAALACFAVAALMIPAGTGAALFHERLFWGGGHVLQILNTALLLVCWQVLGERQWGRGPLPAGLTRAVFLSLLAFAWAAPLLYGRAEPLGLEHRRAFTALLWFALPLPSLLMGGGVALHLARQGGNRRSPASLALGLSLLVFAIGGVAGFFLGLADTRTPSHYHAVIGGVNLGLMGLFVVVVLPLLGRPPSGGKAAALQFHFYGWGQLVHALGFFLAGAAGVPRKSLGLDQGLDSLGKMAAMGVVGLGGGIAVIGGVIFVWGALRRLLTREAGDGPR
ncbi:MAG TPA: hypothetical protein HPQ04_12405 [Rhodospirillaceae bacterium]|nr:hypothetical protein [Rhodospirillaceae bacterium]